MTKDTYIHTTFNLAENAHFAVIRVSGGWEETQARIKKALKHYIEANHYEEPNIHMPDESALFDAIEYANQSEYRVSISIDFTANGDTHRVLLQFSAIDMWED